MKNPTPSSHRFLTLKIFIATVFLLAPNSRVNAQTLVTDTLAVRIILDANGLSTVGVYSIAKISSTNRIYSLDFTGLNLVRLMPEIGSLTALKSLVLRNNILDSLPSEIWNLTSLVTLDIAGNRIQNLTGKISQLKNLLYLGLSRNGLSTLPTEIFGLEQLEVLTISGNRISTLSDTISNLLYLKYLDLADNQLKNIPASLALMQTLDSIDLSGNMISDLPDLIVNMNPVTKVYLGYNQLFGLSTELNKWAVSKDPTYAATQSSSINPRRLTHAQLSLIRQNKIFIRRGKLIMDNSTEGNSNITHEIIIHDVQGRLSAQILKR